MKRAAIARVVVVAGAGSVTTGVWLLAGTGWSLIAGGLWVVVFGLLGIDVNERKREAGRDEPPA